MAARVGERIAEARALLGLGELELASGDPRQGVVLGQQAAALFGELTARLYKARALTLLSNAFIALDDIDAQTQPPLGSCSARESGRTRG